MEKATQSRRADWQTKKQVAREHQRREEAQDGSSRVNVTAPQGSITAVPTSLFLPAPGIPSQCLFRIIISLSPRRPRTLLILFHASIARRKDKRIRPSSQKQSQKTPASTKSVCQRQLTPISTRHSIPNHLLDTNTALPNMTVALSILTDLRQHHILPHVSSFRAHSA